MHLLSLPQELVAGIISKLPLPDVETLAQTFNRRVYDTCIPLITKRILARKHANRMVACFGDRRFESRLSRATEEQAKLLGFESKDEICIPDDPPSFDHLSLDGELSWLEPLDEAMDGIMEGYRRGPAAKEPGHLDRLVADAEKLDLELPAGFVKFMRDEELQYRLASAQAAYFTLGEGFRKCPSKIDKGNGGYFIRILADQQWCYLWHLYLYPGKEKGHVVVGSGGDVHGDLEDTELLEYGVATQEEIDQANKEGFPLASVTEGDICLETCSFEEFLATTYYEELLWFVLFDDAEVTQGLRDYVANTYRKKKDGKAEETKSAST
ncbi:hypothetical protein FALBO_12511 [Fusarium albosuccineum]|uniref:F-box domain-containing protein n=1 Tax=Fusarium albosuccineum TaxID=1237068 RepID=A0A8H4L2W5_9HYPO|nr:hypothetical protein FALBO_12511 [Fusarium albosuccineum]